MTGHRILTEERLRGIVAAVTKASDVKLLSATVTEGAEKGEQYSGELCACNIEAEVGGQRREFHWMAKLPPQDETKQKMTGALHMAEKETRFYTEFIPAYQKLVADHGADIPLNFCPLVHAELDADNPEGSNSLFIMENLTFKSYSNAIDRKKGLTLAHAKLVMAELGRMHAISYAYMTSFPGGLEAALDHYKLMTRDYFCAQPEEIFVATMNQFAEAGFQSMVKLMRYVQEPDQDLASAVIRLDKEVGGIWKHRNQLFFPNERGFNVLCHGDAWFNNMMFEYKSNSPSTPTKVCLIDLALSRWASPATDLAYFLYISTTPQLRKTHLKDLLGHYHDTLVDCFHKLGIAPSIYPFRQLEKDFNKYCIVGFLMSMQVIPGAFAKKGDALDKDDFKFDMQDEESLKKVMELAERKSVEAMNNEPLIKILISGNIHDMIDRGVLKMD